MLRWMIFGLFICVFACLLVSRLFLARSVCWLGQSLAGCAGGQAVVWRGWWVGWQVGG